MIESKDISVIVQGAIDKKLTYKCLKSIKKYLPQAEIILSTWEGSDLKKIKKYCDKTILNKDPGAVIFNDTFDKYNNVNRQLLSTQNGLKQATRKYVLKFRTDFYLKNVDFLIYYDIFSKRNNEYSFFDHRVIVSAIYSKLKASHNNLPVPFHPNDCYLFGLKEDICSYFMDTPFMDIKDMAGYLYKNTDKIPYENATCRYYAEQYYCLNFIKRYIDIKGFDDLTCSNRNIEKLSENILFNNFIFLEPLQSGISSIKHKEAFENGEHGGNIIHYDLFVNTYKQLCDREFNIKNAYPIRYKYRKHLYRVLEPFKNLIKYINECISLTYYTCLLIFRSSNGK